MRELGMLWSISDSDRKQPLEHHVREAADYYISKYGSQATECWVHPMALEAAGGLAWVGPIKMCASRTVARWELWIGVGKTVTIEQR